MCEGQTLLYKQRNAKYTLDRFFLVTLNNSMSSQCLFSGIASISRKFPLIIILLNGVGTSL